MTGLLHVTGATDERGRKNDTLTDGAQVVVPAVNYVCKATILRRPEFVLVLRDVRKACVLDTSVRVNDPFLEEAAIVEEASRDEHTKNNSGTPNAQSRGKKDTK